VTSPELEAQRIIATADERSNNIVVSGPQSTLTLIWALVDKLDADTSQLTTFFLYKVKYGQAADMANTLNSLFGTGTGGGVRTSTTTGAGTRGTTIGTNSTGIGSSAGLGSGGLGGGSAGGRGGTTTGGRGGTTGGGLGGTTTGGRGGTGGGGLGTTGGGGLGTTGGGFGATGGGGLGSTGAAGRTGTGAAALASGNTGSQSSDDLTGAAYVVPDVDTNSLLVAVVSQYKPEVQTVIEQLDRPIAQVLIKVLVAEVSHDDSSDFGMDFSALDLRTTATSNNGSRAASSFGNLGAFNSNGGLLLQVTESNVQAAMHALAVQGKLDVLSRPYILCSDNQTAEITVGQSVPIITNSTISNLGTTQNTIQYQSVGIILLVQPHVNQEGLVTCLVEPEVSSLSDQSVPISSNGLTAPVFNTRTAQTYVAIQNGQTIVIGGMIGDQKTQTFQKIPVLGDIPLVGPLFGRTQFSDTRTELLIFMTPHVALRPEFLLGQTQDEMKEVTNQPDLAGPLEGMKAGSTTLPAPEDVVDPFLLQRERQAEAAQAARRGGAAPPPGVGPMQTLPTGAGPGPQP
jgi:general secretion pathway protein D